MPTTGSSPTPSQSNVAVANLARIAVGVDGYPEGRDAAVLGAALARSTGADTLLVTVVSHPRVAPSWVGWQGLRDAAEEMLAQTRDSLAPGTRVMVETGAFVAPALEHVVAREHRDLLVVGSSRFAAEGHVRIGKRTRQLLGHAECALAIAPRGLHHKTQVTITRIGVGFDGGPEAQAALVLAGSIALSAGATLHIRGVVDDRTPRLRWSDRVAGTILPLWDDVIQADVHSLHDRVAAAAQSTEARSADADVMRGRPADALLELSRDVDLLIIGSRRWGLVTRLLLGSTGEALLHDASCPILIVPRTTG